MKPLAMIENSTIVNMVGKKCVEKAIAKATYTQKPYCTLKAFLHAQIVKL